MAARVAVIGGGAVGTVIAAAAQRAGHQVSVCVRNRTGPLILHRDGRRRELAVTVVDDQTTVSPVDWVFLATKAYDVVSAARWLPPLLGGDSVAVVCQNGINHVERVSPFTGACPILPAVVSIVASRTGPGEVVHRQGGALTVAQGVEAAALRDLFGDTDELDIVLSADFERIVWLKFLGNLAAAPVTTLTMRPLGVLRSADLHPLLEQLVSEAVNVATASGVDLRESDVPETIRLLACLDPAAVTSMQSDRAAGRPLEIELLTGELVRRADQLGLPVPWNRAMLSLLRHLATPGDQ
ncbi:MAG TPA: 2-dehydropantoate 2-reductase [Micromonosporaceae bacterium]